MPSRQVVWCGVEWMAGQKGAQFCAILETVYCLTHPGSQGALPELHPLGLGR